MSVQMQVVLPVLLTVALGAVALTPATARTTLPTFQAYDGDADGSISLEEFQAQGGLVKAFHDGDLNRDLRLSKDELAQASAETDRIMTASFVDDAWITAKVKTMLLKDDVVKGLEVNVETKKGTVQLSGWVNDAHQIAQAEDVARRVEGVKTVRNDLQIKR
jgi:hyperosmotically inducible protein